MPKTDQEHLKMIKDAISNPSVPKLYANGFVSSIGSGDTCIVFQQNGIPVVTLNLSFTVAKTLSIKLGGLIKDMEKDSANKIMTTDEIGSLLKSVESKEQLEK